MSAGLYVADRDAAGSVDQLIARVAGRLRSAHPQLPEHRLHELAEEVVQDAVRFVLGWVEAPVDADAGP